MTTLSNPSAIDTAEIETRVNRLIRYHGSVVDALLAHINYGDTRQGRINLKSPEFSAIYRAVYLRLDQLMLASDRASLHQEKSQ
jgi:hypothetical protein